MVSRVAVVVAVVLLAVLLAGAAVPATAGHGSRSNYTVIPYNHQPGADGVTYEQHAVSPVNFDYLDFIKATWEAGDFSNCGPSNSKRFGIDRNNDASGTKTDEGLSKHVEESKITEDVFKADFYEKNDAVGTSTYLAKGDEFVGLTTDCFGNPEDPGWYQIHTTIGGTLQNGTYVTAQDSSHYFYICDCTSRKEARKKLGPPPSKQSNTEQATATASHTGTRTPPATGTPLPETTPTGTHSTSGPGTRTDASTGGGNNGSSHGTEAGGDAARTAGTPTSTPKSWKSIARKTPTMAGGAGFGPVIALVAFIGAAAATRRD